MTRDSDAELLESRVNSRGISRAVVKARAWSAARSSKSTRLISRASDPETIRKNTRNRGEALPLSLFGDFSVPPPLSLSLSQTLYLASSPLFFQYISALGKGIFAVREARARECNQLAISLSRYRGAKKGGARRSFKSG